MRSSRVALVVAASALAALPVVLTWSASRRAAPERRSPGELASEICAAGPEADWKTEVQPRLVDLEALGPEAAPTWVRLLDEAADPRVRRVAARELGEHPLPGSAGALSRAVLGTADETLREIALGALARQGREGVGFLLDLVERAGDLRLRFEAARTVPGVAGAEDAPRVFDLCLAEENDAVRSFLGETLARADGRGAALRAAAALRGAGLGARERIRALEIVARAGWQVPTEVLASELASPEPEVRMAAIDALVAAAREEAYPHLRGLYEGDPAAEVRLLALAGLGRLGPGPGRDFLHSLARDRAADPVVRSAALEALALEAAGACQPLFRELTLRDEPEPVRSTASRLLDAR